MQIHQIRPATKFKKKKRIGRGGKRGSYSGKGIKGQKARAGRKIRPAMRDIIKKIPKKRGYRMKSFKEKPKIINLQDLEKNFKEDAVINLKALMDKKLVSLKKGRIPAVKILGKGKLTKKLTIKGLTISKLAEEKIKKAKGIIL